MHSQYFEPIKSFLNEIGIPFIETKFEDDLFLPGLKIDKGTLFYDPEKLKYPGDILHEAGQIALMTSEEKETIVGDVKEYRTPGQDNEMGVMCWSYAALVHLNIPIEIVFHPDGYNGYSEMLIMEYTNKQYRGLPLLVWMEFCDYETFPNMKKWVRV